MEVNFSKIVDDAIRDGIREGVKNRLSASYNNPLDKLTDAALAGAAGPLKTMLDEAVSSCANDPEFRDQIRAGVRASLAKILVQRFGGELEKQVNALKSNPATRARITVAIEQIIAEKPSA